jgi:hypothetical protein
VCALLARCPAVDPCSACHIGRFRMLLPNSPGVWLLLQVKIGDFGFTKRLACNERSLTVDRITHPRWVAPEVCEEGLTLCAHACQVVG